jgi:hypothetical protein
LAQVFLSHSSRDKRIVRKLASDLKAAGVGVWLDEWVVQVGTPITQAISSGLDVSDFVGVWLTAAAVESRWVEREWQAKFAEEVQTGRITVLPLLAETCAVPALLRDKRFADFRNSYNDGLNALLGAIAAPAELRIDLDLSVLGKPRWRLLGCPLEITTSVRGPVGARKLAVFQRSAGEPENTWHFQFEASILPGTNTIRGRVWLGTRTSGSGDFHQLLALVVPSSARFARHPLTVSLDEADFGFAASCLVQRIE